MLKNNTQPNIQSMFHAEQPHVWIVAELCCSTGCFRLERVCRRKETVQRRIIMIRSAVSVRTAAM